MNRQALLRGLALGESLAGGARRHEREISPAVRALRGAAADDAFAVAVVRAAALLLQGRPAAQVRAELPQSVPDRVLAHVLRQVLPQATADLDALRDQLVACARPHLGPRFARAHPNQGVALLGGVHALAVALAPDIAPRHALESVAAEGQDADAVAAICGALLGARFGSDWM
jgi:ADP-ribosylglycohydrolase